MINKSLVYPLRYSVIDMRTQEKSQDMNKYKNFYYELLDVSNKKLRNKKFFVYDVEKVERSNKYNGEDVLQNCKEKELGYNALTNNYENLVETGVINSVKVDRYSLINATSIASTVITMGGVIVDENSPEQNVLQLQTSNGVML